jgi:hypothetical protein
MLLFASCKNINESKQDTGTSLLTDSVENKESIVPSSAVKYAEGSGVLKSIDAAGVVNNEIKEKKAELRTEMMKTNPIQKTFYGSALGTKSVRSIVNQLKNLGYEVEKFGNGQYFCDISGKVDDVYWNSIRIVSFNGIMFTSADVDDREPLKQGSFLSNIKGKLCADKGYIGKTLFENLFLDGIQLITKIKNNMKNVLMNINDKILIRRRAVIETVNDELKNIAQIEHSRHRSFNNFIANALSAIAAYCFFEKKPAIEVEFVNDGQLTLF